MGRLLSGAQLAFDRAFGVKPGRDVPKLDRLRWFRRYYLRNLVPVVFCLAVLLLFSAPAWLDALIAVPWTVGFAILHWQIGHEERRQPD
jgi:hypothetical protein